VIAHDETCAVVFDGPRGREVALLRNHCANDGGPTDRRQRGVLNDGNRHDNAA
jgi:hypothetical protein